MDSIKKHFRVFNHTKDTCYYTEDCATPSKCYEQVVQDYFSGSDNLKSDLFSYLISPKDWYLATAWLWNKPSVEVLPFASLSSFWHQVYFEHPDTSSL